MNFTFNQIGVIHSCFKEKFGIPRQPGLVPEARAVLELLPPYNRAEAVRGLEDFSHLWVMFVFHADLSEAYDSARASARSGSESPCGAYDSAGASARSGSGSPCGAWKPTVRPPRLGGNRRLGVFATRSPNRPNPVGLSVVALEKIVCEAGRVELHLQGIDLLDGTPVIDIKPYLPYVDSVPQATGGFAQEAPAAPFEVVFAPQALEACRAVPGLEALVRQLLGRDPRPAYYGKGGGRQSFGMRLLDYDVKWQVEGEDVVVTEIVRAG